MTTITATVNTQHALMAQTGSLPCRRLATCVALRHLKSQPKSATPCRLPVGDTADKLSALRSNANAVHLPIPHLAQYPGPSIDAPGFPVAQTGSLPCRRLATCVALRHLKSQSKFATPCRLPVSDTADKLSALLFGRREMLNVTCTGAPSIAVRLHWKGTNHVFTLNTIDPS